MDQKKFQKAQQYDRNIRHLREELSQLDKCTRLQLRPEYGYGPKTIPPIEKDLASFPELKAAIRTALKTELAEYEQKFKEL